MSDRTRLTADYGHRTNFKNAIINGDFNTWQRGASFVSPSSGSYNADRFMYVRVGSMAHTITRETDAPNGNFAYSMKVDCTTADATLGTTDQCQVRQRVEGYSILPFVGKTGVFSYWIKSSKTGTMCVCFRNSGNDRNYIAETTINVANTWEYKEIVVPFDYTGGTWNYENNLGLEIMWILAAGTNFIGTADIWNTDFVFSTSNQVNFCDSVDNDIFITGVQLEIGSKATPFEFRPYKAEMALCQRYYVVGQYTGAGVMRAASGNLRFYRNVDFPVQMRGNPTITTTPNTIDLYQDPVDGTAATTDVSNWTVTGSSMSIYGFYLNGTRVGIVGSRSNAYVSTTWTADAEL